MTGHLFWYFIILSWETVLNGSDGLMRPFLYFPKKETLTFFQRLILNIYILMMTATFIEQLQNVM